MRSALRLVKSLAFGKVGVGREVNLLSEGESKGSPGHEKMKEMNRD